MNASRLILRVYHGAVRRINAVLTGYFGRALLKSHAIRTGKSCLIRGMPVIDVHRAGHLTIGDSFTMNSGKLYNRIGRQQACMLIVGNNATLTIGNNVGMSSTVIICIHEITICDNVKIGGNTVIYDTDFHALDAERRTRVPEDTTNVRTAPVVIGKNVFIGAHSTILKGSIIGENSVIGACSVVRGAVPAGELWAGNPATFIRKLQ